MLGLCRVIWGSGFRVLRSTCNSGFEGYAGFKGQGVRGFRVQLACSLGFQVVWGNIRKSMSASRTKSCVNVCYEVPT